MSLCFIASESCEATKKVPDNKENKTLRKSLPKPSGINKPRKMGKTWRPAAPFKDPKIQARWIAKATEKPHKYQMIGNNLFILQ